MNFKKLKIKPKIGDSVYDIDSTFPLGLSKPILTPRSFIVEKVEEDGVWVKDRFLNYEFIYPTIQDCEIEINKYNN